MKLVKVPSMAGLQAQAKDGLHALLEAPDWSALVVSYLTLPELGLLVQTCKAWKTALLPSGDEGTIGSCDWWWRAVGVATLEHRYGLGHLIKAGSTVKNDTQQRRVGAAEELRRRVSLRWLREGQASAGRAWQAVLPPTPGASCPVAREGCVVCALVGVEGWVVFGGRCLSTQQLYNDTWIIHRDSHTGQWRWQPLPLTPHTRAPHPRAFGDAVVVMPSPDSYVLLIYGGLVGSYRYNDTWWMDLTPALSALSTPSPPISPSSISHSIFPPGLSPSVSSSVSPMAVPLLTWQVLSSGGPSTPPPRTHHSLTLLPSASQGKGAGVLVLFGGRAVGEGGQSLKDTWILDLRHGVYGSWVKLNVNQPNAPSPRHAHVAIAMGHNLLVLGGHGLQEEHTLWELDVCGREWLPPRLLSPLSPQLCYSGGIGRGLGRERAVVVAGRQTMVIDTQLGTHWTLNKTRREEGRPGLGVVGWGGGHMLRLEEGGEGGLELWGMAWVLPLTTCHDRQGGKEWQRLGVPVEMGRGRWRGVRGGEGLVVVGGREGDRGMQAWVLDLLT